MDCTQEPLEGRVRQEQTSALKENVRVDGFDVASLIGVGTFITLTSTAMLYAWHSAGNQVGIADLTRSLQEMTHQDVFTMNHLWDVSWGLGVGVGLNAFHEGVQAYRKYRAALGSRDNPRYRA
jgi:hypothetical protein